MKHREIKRRKEIFPSKREPATEEIALGPKIEVLNVPNLSWNEKAKRRKSFYHALCLLPVHFFSGFDARVGTKVVRGTLRRNRMAGGAVKAEKQRSRMAEEMASGILCRISSLNGSE